VWIGHTVVVRSFVKHSAIGISVKMLHLLTHGAELFLRSRQLCSHSRTSQHFMEPEVSIPCSKGPSTCSHPEPYQSNPHHPILSLIRSILMLSTHLRLGLPSDLFPSGFPTNILHAFLFFPNFIPRQTGRLTVGRNIRLRLRLSWDEF
jgi:hypothetical protein